MAQRQGTHLLGHADLMAARLGTECLAAAAKLRRRLVAMAGAARALLLVHLLAGDRDLGPVLGMVRAGHALQRLPANHALQQVGARLEIENLVLELERSGRSRIECSDIGPHHPCSLLGAAAPSAPADLRNAPGLGASFGSGFLTAS